METVTGITPYPWPRVDAGVAARRSRLLAASGRLAFDAGGSRWSVHFLPETPRGYRPAFAAEATVDGRPLRLDLDRLPLPRLLGYPLDGVPALEVPEDLLPALLEGALEGMLAAAENALGAPIRLDGFREVPRGEGAWAEEAEGDRLDLGLKEIDGSGRIRARLFLGGMEMEALAAAADAAPRVPGESDSPSTAQLPFRLVIRAGEVPLTAEELAGLEPGDVVMLDRNPDAPGALRLGAGESGHLKFKWTATRKGATVLIDKEIPMDTLEKPTAPEGAAAGLEALEVPLAFDLGARPATLAELRSLAAGSVMELPENPEGRVTLRAGGRAIGAGTLVMLGDRAGVRIDTLWREDAP